MRDCSVNLEKQYENNYHKQANYYYYIVICENNFSIPSQASTLLTTK